MNRLSGIILAFATLTFTYVAADHHGGGAAHPFNGKNLLDWSFKEKKTKEGKLIKPKWVVGTPSLAGSNEGALAADAGEGASQFWRRGLSAGLEATSWVVGQLRSRGARAAARTSRCRS